MITNQHHTGNNMTMMALDCCANKMYIHHRGDENEFTSKSADCISPYTTLKDPTFQLSVII